MFTLFESIGYLIANYEIATQGCKKKNIKTSDSIVLRNGYKVSKATVDNVMKTLQSFNRPFDKHYDPESILLLLEKCKNPQAQMRPFVEMRLQHFELLDNDGNLSEDVGNIVLSAIEEDESSPNGFELVNPIEQVAAKTPTLTYK